MYIWLQMLNTKVHSHNTHNTQNPRGFRCVLFHEKLILMKNLMDTLSLVYLFRIVIFLRNGLVSVLVTLHPVVKP